MRADWLNRPETVVAIEGIRADTLELVDRLNRFLDVKGHWVVDSNESQAACQQALRERDLDMVLLAYQTWAEDARLISLLQAIGDTPLVLWCYLPSRRAPRPIPFPEVLRNSGPVGAFGALGTLRNLKVSFMFTFGAIDDPRLVSDLKVAGQAAQVRQGLRKARFGLLPARNDQMQCTFVDEFRLMADFGPVVQYLSVSELRRVVESLSKEQVEDYLAQIHQRFAVQDVSEETLRRAAEVALGLGQLAADYHLDLLAINDTAQELHRTFQLRPALYPNLNDPQPVLFQAEGDLGAATANYILHHLTNSPTMFLELWFWDGARNQIIGGHAGLQNPDLAGSEGAWISPDYEFNQTNDSEGAQFQFLARPGRITLFQLRSMPQGWQAIATTGICLEGQPAVQGYPHVILRLDTPIDHFLNEVATVGATQHWVMAYGSVIQQIEAFCHMEDIPLVVIHY